MGGRTFFSSLLSFFSKSSSSPSPMAAPRVSRAMAASAALPPSYPVSRAFFSSNSAAAARFLAQLDLGAMLEERARRCALQAVGEGKG